MVQMLQDYPEENTHERALYEFLAAVSLLEEVLEPDSDDADDLDKFSAKIWQPDFSPSPSERPLWAASHRNWANAIPEVIASTGSRMALLMDSFDLCDFEMAVLMLGCLQRFEPRYGRAITKLKDNGTSALTQSLALRLLCPGQFLRNHYRAALLHDAPLVRAGLLELHKNSAQLNDPVIQTSDMVYHFLLGHDVLPESLTSLVQWRQLSHSVWLDDEVLIRNWRQGPDEFPSVIELRHAPSIDPEAAAVSLAQRMGLKALAVDPQILRQVSERKSLMQQALGAARLHRALLILPEADPASEKEEEGGESVSWNELSELIRGAALPVCCCIAASGTCRPLPSLTRWVIQADLPDVSHRVETIKKLLSELEVEDADWYALASRIALSDEQIRLAVAEAEVAQRQKEAPSITYKDLSGAFFQQARQNFGHLAQREAPVRTLSDLIVSDELYQHLQEILIAVRYREKSLARGFARKVGRATGISALFHGDPGTGKTLVAEVLAHELGVDLIRVDLAKVVNKYIGETEKNLARIFDLAAQDAGVLFFDEADALFGKRSESKDSKDRHANIEIAYLLQRLESHPGLVLLATNNRTHLDDAFTRRFTFIAQFSYPDAALRERLWRAVWPESLCLAEDVDFSRLAKCPLTGANIRNIALMASWLAGDEQIITEDHIQHALQREMKKVGM
ncbi:ATP-binding protein [Enterobacter bugandensis]|uniref:ATP-binding protein n=1 Tax=Enterobacter bugandensis TaxID=881260 RepID=UPI002FD4E9AE